MDKLTTEQKAKAYDEALSVARKTHQTQPMYRDWLEKMFPELTESEDEKIRKFLIQMAQNGHGEDKDWWNKCVAWLEKQCEKSQRIVSAEAKEAMYDKPAPVRTGPIGFDGEPMESKPCEQKPAWSEEDERYINIAVSAFSSPSLERLYHYNKVKSNDLINWLKSIKPQSTWKPSDEQMTILNEVLNFAANHESLHWNDYIFGTLNNLIRQLKKLREE